MSTLPKTVLDQKTKNFLETIKPLSDGQRKALDRIMPGRWVWLTSEHGIAECFDDENNILRFRLNDDESATRI